MICPSCQNEQRVTDHNFGALYTCTSCQAVYFINFDGVPEYGEMISENSTTESVAEINPALNDPELPEEYLNEALDVQSTIDQQVEMTRVQTLAQKINNAALNNINDFQSANAFADIAQEISDFGNADAQISGLNYDLHVSGIDNLDTKKLFQEAIEDSKFAWDSSEIMRSIRNGEVIVYKMSPVKAYLLAKRIQFLDIEKKWKQNVLG